MTALRKRISLKEFKKFLKPKINQIAIRDNRANLKKLVNQGANRHSLHQAGILLVNLNKNQSSSKSLVLVTLKSVKVAWSRDIARGDSLKDTSQQLELIMVSRNWVLKIIRCPLTSLIYLVIMITNLFVKSFTKIHLVSWWYMIRTIVIALALLYIGKMKWNAVRLIWLV